MILQPCNVELTKVHYYGKTERNAGIIPTGISTISEICENHNNTNIIIKNNIFGHRWVLKINEDRSSSKEKRKNIKLFIYILVSCWIVIAISFGVYFTIDRHIIQNYLGDITAPDIVKHNTTIIIFKPLNDTKIYEKQLISSTTTSPVSEANEKITNKYDETKPLNKICGDCQTPDFVCLKTQLHEKPKCIEATDKKDPTGCGGLCLINREYCQLLDAEMKVYQCSQIKNLLQCPGDMFNCGNMCIARNKQCDGIIHCSNYLDEKDCECNLDTHFQCSNKTSCFENIKKCDGIVDCWDRSDEENCYKACLPDKFPCLVNGECIEKEQFCDGIPDCTDKSDEPIGCQT